MVRLEPVQRPMDPFLAFSYVRSPVLVARKNSFRYCFIHGPMRSSESP